MPHHSFDVIIIGGSAAGLSAAMTLGRSLRKVLVIDHGKPCNIQSPRVHNFITRDGKSPAEIMILAKEQTLKYPTVQFLEDKVISASKNANGFLLETESTTQFNSKKILLATGLTDICPDISGFSDCWGISILHCPYCHGYEVKGEPTAILANGEAAYNLGILIYNWSKNVTILTNDISELREHEKNKLEELGITIIEKDIAKISHTNGQMETVHFKDGSLFSIGVMYGSIPFRQQSDLALTLGCKLTEKGHIEIDAQHRTTVEGVYAAGDNTAEHRAISVAAASGNIAGFTINADLL